MGYYEFKFSPHPHQRVKLTEIVLILTANSGVLPSLSFRGQFCLSVSNKYSNTHYRTSDRETM